VEKESWSLAVGDFGLEGERMRCYVCGSKDPDIDDGRCMDCISAGIANREEARGWLQIASDFERRLTACEIRSAALELALTSAIVCDTCIGARQISCECEGCLVGDGAPCTCDDMPEFDCPQCDGLGWHHREPARFKDLCQELYEKHLNYLPEKKG